MIDRVRTCAAVMALFVGATLLVPLRAGADHDVPVLPDVFPKIREIVSPLAGAPAIVEDGTTLRVELDAARLGPPPPNAGAFLLPSFGHAREPVSLSLASIDVEVPSALWPDRIVHTLTFDVPEFGDGFVEDLYDLHVRGLDVQHRAVKVVDEIPAEPTFAIIADPSVGDPRPIQEGFDDFQSTGNPDPFIDKTTKTVGNPMNEDRWAALGKAIDEINLVQPDFVLVSGDLTFAFYPRPANVEYEDAYRILSRLRVPTYLSPGNHDLYEFDYDDTDRPHTTDGHELWPLYFGPHYYSVDVGEDLHIVSLNTFDWSNHEREPFNEDNDFSTRAGGQIDDAQFAWLSDDLDAYRERNPDGSVITFAHHDPSWIKARHPWPGKNRLETRELFADEHVGVHFSGHTHEDRVARYHEGHVVETNGRFGPHGELHYVLNTDTLDDSRTQEELGAIIHDPTHGPVFVSTTTVSSVLKGSDWGLGSYWGWRLGTLDRVGPGFDPVDFGYPATREFLDRIAERPERWNPDHAEYGVFSYPSYHLDAVADGPNDGTREAVTVELSSRLLVDMDLVVPVSVRGDDVEVTGGTVLRTRTVDGATDLWVNVSLGAGDEATVRVTAS